jgi:hypothetical protein
VSRTLASGWTFVYKYPFPLFVFGIVVAFTTDVILRPGIPRYGRGSPLFAAPGFDVLFPVVGAIVCLTLWVWAASFKRVKLADEGLLVSDYFEEALIPFSEIESVWRSHGWRPATVTIRFRHKSRVGSAARFIPNVSARADVDADDLEMELDRLVGELQERAGLRQQLT